MQTNLIIELRLWLEHERGAGAHVLCLSTG
ncbi:Uncharacterised protein [Legionella cherrii]|uniref:Uncharacterized protein n=1 Tax=Legionella cherrii TaxID=28084 RepID=A0ABY6T6Y7_9GAMM|nr:Uncharacterised protein [Legionella cherrii]